MKATGASRLAAALALVTATLSSCFGGSGDRGPQPDATAAAKVGPGVDRGGRVVRVGEITDLSGPAAAVGKPLTEGHRVFFRALNDAGGIAGWRVEMVEKDAQFSPQGHKQAYGEIKNQVALIAQSFETPTTAAILDEARADRMVVSPTRALSHLAREENLLLIGTTYRVETMNALDYLRADKGAREGSKVGIVHQNDEYGQDALAGFEKAAAAFRFAVVQKLSYSPGERSFTAQVAQLRDSGAQFVHLAVTPSQVGPILSAAEQRGFRPVWTMDGVAFDPTVLTVGKLPVELFRSVYVTSSLATWAEGAPGMSKMLEHVQRYSPNQAPSASFTFGYAQAWVVSELIRHAIERDDLTREGLLRTFTELRDVETGGLLPALSYGATPAERIPTRESRMYQVDDARPDKLKAITRPAASEVARSDGF